MNCLPIPGQMNCALFVFVALKLTPISFCRAQKIHTMGKSSKKSAVEVAPAAGLVPDGKSGKKGIYLSNHISPCFYVVISFCGVTLFISICRQEKCGR